MPDANAQVDDSSVYLSTLGSADDPGPALRFSLSRYPSYQKLMPERPSGSTCARSWLEDLMRDIVEEGTAHGVPDRMLKALFFGGDNRQSRHMKADPMLTELMRTVDAVEFIMSACGEFILSSLASRFVDEYTG